MKHPIAIAKNCFRHMHSCTEWHLEYSSPKCCKGMFVHQRHTLDAAYARERKLREKLAWEIIALGGGEEGERSLPGNPEFLASGYSERMLERYFVAGAVYCRGKNVLDTCSGVGWGTRILAEYAREVHAVEIDPAAISAARNRWPLANIRWEKGNVLAQVDTRFYDVAIAMESIEHFTKEDGHRYMANLAASLLPGGILIGSSAFPPSREDADRLAAKNPFHLHIYTRNEMDALLDELFVEHAIVDNWMFFARKAR